MLLALQTGLCKSHSEHFRCREKSQLAALQKFESSILRYGVDKY